MLKLLQYEAVSVRGWIDESTFASMLGSTFLFPGLTAVKLSALIGYQVAGAVGLLMAVLALNLPGLVLALIGYRLLAGVDSVLARQLMMIVQYGAVALLAAALFSIASGVVKQHASLTMYCLTATFFVLLALFDLPPFWGLIGFIALSYGLLMMIH